MAKKNEDGSWIALVIFFAASLLALIYLLSSVCYLVAWAYFEIKSIMLGKANSFADFDLSSEEKEELKNSEKQYLQITQSISDISEQGSHLSTRQDGFFHARSKLGKELNAQLEKLLPEGHRLQFHIEYLKGLPSIRKNKWVFNNSMKKAFRFGFPVYAASIVIFSKYYVPEWIVNIGTWIKENSIIEFFDMPSIYYGALLPSIAITIIFAAIIFFVSLISYNKKFV